MDSSSKKKHFTPEQLLFKEIVEKNFDDAEKMLNDNPDLLHLRFLGGTWLHHIAKSGNVPFAADLLKRGISVNAATARYGDGPLDSAIGGGSPEMVTFLLQNGANPNQSRELILACALGNFEIVKLLVEHGAKIHRVFGEKKEPRINALSQAIDYGHDEIAEYLASLGATEPEQSDAEGEAQSWRKAIVAAMEIVHGKALSVALTQIAPGKLPLSVHVIPPTVARPTNILFTTGMSAKPIKVPKGMDKYQFAEISVELPPDWPIRGPKSQEPENAWPIQWLLQVATYPQAKNIGPIQWLLQMATFSRANRATLGGPVTIIANGEPPAPLAPNTSQSCLLLTAELLAVNSLEKKRPREIAMYRMFPLYREERDLEKEQGIAALGELFDRANVRHVVDVKRKNVAAG